MKFATPGLSAGSCSVPAPRISRKLTDGCSWWSTTSTLRPFGSVLISYGGKSTGREASAAGGRLIGHCWAEATQIVRTTAVAVDGEQTRARAHRMLPSRGSSKPGGNAAGPAALRQNRQQHARLRREVGLRHALHVRERHVLKQVELAVGGLDVVVDHDGMRQVQRLLLHASRGPRM